MVQKVVRVMQRSVEDLVAMRVQKDSRGAGWEETPSTTTLACFIRDGGGISNSGQTASEAGRLLRRRVEHWAPSSAATLEAIETVL